METPPAFLANCFGLLLRFAVPIVMTSLAVYLLRKLDAHWQAQAEAELQAKAAKFDRPACWKIKDCPPEQRQACPAFMATEACWQAYRLPNGYLPENCLACEVFLNAPVPNVPIYA